MKSDRSKNKEKFLKLWRAEKSIYKAWGDFVESQIKSSLEEKIKPKKIDSFLRIPLTSRLKDENSLVAKAFYRGKDYSNPYDEIEDKIGLRIVVLLSTEIRIVEEVIKENENWTAEKSRDFHDERQAKPFEFDYQSLHYILKNKSIIKFNEITIPEGIPCEIQIRTILQHAYSELTHDTIYKQTTQADPDVKRAAAKSMALIEATDDYFLQVCSKINNSQKELELLNYSLRELYNKYIGVTSEEKPLNSIIIDYLSKFIKEEPVENISLEIEKFISEKKFVIERIKNEIDHNLLYKQPVIFLIFWLIPKNPRGIANDCPLSKDDLIPIYSILGIKFPENAWD